MGDSEFIDYMLRHIEHDKLPARHTITEIRSSTSYVSHCEMYRCFYSDLDLPGFGPWFTETANGREYIYLIVSPHAQRYYLGQTDQGTPKRLFDHRQDGVGKRLGGTCEDRYAYMIFLTEMQTQQGRGRSADEEAFLHEFFIAASLAHGTPEQYVTHRTRKFDEACRHLGKRGQSALLHQVLEGLYAFDTFLAPTIGEMMNEDGHIVRPKEWSKSLSLPSHEPAQLSLVPQNVPLAGATYRYKCSSRNIDVEFEFLDDGHVRLMQGRISKEPSSSWRPGNHNISKSVRQFRADGTSWDKQTGEVLRPTEFGTFSAMIRAVEYAVSGNANNRKIECVNTGKAFKFSDIKDDIAKGSQNQKVA